MQQNQHKHTKSKLREVNNRHLNPTLKEIKKQITWTLNLMYSTKNIEFKTSKNQKKNT